MVNLLVAVDFRPTSCCNMLYEFLSKVLCWRLRNLLIVLINQKQATFVPSWELLHNVLLC